jgi:hypothetical protein
MMTILSRVHGRVIGDLIVDVYGILAVKPVTFTDIFIEKKRRLCVL